MPHPFALMLLYKWAYERMIPAANKKWVTANNQSNADPD